MDNPTPEKHVREPSRAPQLIDDCRRALRSRSEAPSLLQSLLTGLTHEHTALVARFDRQRPGWNESGSRDKLRIAAEATLRICVKTLQLRLEQWDCNPLSPELITGTVNRMLT